MKRGLGKGLSALMAEASEPSGVSEIDIFLIDNDKNQPRKHFDKEKLEELAQSVRVHGIMQPILVYEKDGRYTIVAGERRFRAAKIAGLKKVPAIVREFSGREILEFSLIENIQREDLNPIEQAAALSQLVTQYKLTQEQAAERVGKSRSAIANMMRLLSLPDDVKEMVQQGGISAGHARCLLAMEDSGEISGLAREIAEKGLSVRQAEELAPAAKKQAGGNKPKKAANPRQAELKTLRMRCARRWIPKSR
jgi:ParB family chromosome partitioning protein